MCAELRLLEVTHVYDLLLASYEGLGTTGSTMFHRMSVCILILTNLLSLAFCSIPSLRFCEAVFHGSQSVQEDWIRHLQKHILDLRFNKACPPPDPERHLVPGIEPSATTTTPVLLAPLVV